MMFCTPILSADSLVNRMRRMSIHHLNQTQSGKDLISKIPKTVDLHGILIFEDIRGLNSKRISQMLSKRDGEKLNINANFLAASPLYMSWLLAYSIGHYRIAQIEQEHEVQLPFFIESSQWMMYWAMKHWKDWRYPNSHDYTKHPEDHIAKFAKLLMASSTKFTRAYRNSNSAFFSEVKSRHLSLGYGNNSIDDFIQNSKNTNAIAAAKQLKWLIESELN